MGLSEGKPDMTWIIVRGIINFLWRYKGVVFVVLILGALGGFHKLKVSQAYAAGEIAERAKWNEAVRLTELARDTEKREAEREIEAKRIELIEAEDVLAAERQRRREELAARIREQNAPIVIPDAFLKPLREIGR